MKVKQGLCEGLVEPYNKDILERWKKNNNQSVILYIDEGVIYYYIKLDTDLLHYVIIDGYVIDITDENEKDIENTVHNLYINSRLKGSYEFPRVDNLEYLNNLKETIYLEVKGIREEDDIKIIQPMLPTITILSNMETTGYKIKSLCLMK